MSISKCLGDRRFYHVLARIDADLAGTARQAGCRRCGGVLHSARYPRKARGAPVEAERELERRASFCCAVCRKRETPPSVRFLGRRIYVGAVVVLAAALQQGSTPWRARRLRERFGVSLQTLERWQTWWQEAFIDSRFWKAAKAAFSPAVDELGAPRTLLERFSGNERDRIIALLRFLSPLSTPAAYTPDRRG